MANYLPMCLGTTMRKWLFLLPANSINSQEDLNHQLVNNFSMTYDQEKTQYDLEQALQKEDESLHNYIKRWHDVMSEETTIFVFCKVLN